MNRSLKHGLSRAAFALALALAALSPLPSIGTASVHAQEDEAYLNAVVQVAAASEIMADWLPNFENWIGNASETEYPDVYYVEFYDNAEEEWLGYVTINGTTGEIYDAFAPKPLPPDVYAEQLPLVEEIVKNDPEVAAILDNPIFWDVYTDYNRWERLWETRFYRGLEGILVRIYFDAETNEFWVDSIIDENHLSEEQALSDARDRAISLAYEADGIDSALNGIDDWTTIVQHMRGSQWSVSFVTTEQEWFYALVDLATARVVESAAR
ncbi:MAG: hypothetical protein SGI73_07925 [Chloroflexota bacterium]|nr:hypothetical protein [Chloroflexota bacterium]